MHQDNRHHWKHGHTFGQDRRRPGERRTLMVIGLTGTAMVGEIAAGIVFGSMALLADGLHMASHAVALSVNAFAYIYARRHAHDRRFSFGTGKINALGGFTGAVLLAVFALLMVWGSLERMANPIPIAFNQAILVAVLGLLVNGVSMFILGVGHDPHGEDHGHEHGHDRAHGHDHHHDHNLRSAYLHVLADAVTSLLAIFALLTAKYTGFMWMDPLMGLVGAGLVFRWSWGLLRISSTVLVDGQAPESIQKRVRESIEAQGDTRVADLHLWSIGPNIYSAALTLVTDSPRPPQVYKQSIPEELGVVHTTVEVHSVSGHEAGNEEAMTAGGAHAAAADISHIGMEDGREAPEPLPSARDAFEEIARLAEGKRITVFLDYDGTLSPIVENPDLAVMQPEMRHVVIELSRHCPVGILSGRDLKDVQDKVRIDSIVYAGSHGFDIAAPRELQVENQVGSEFLPALDRAEEALSRELHAVDGLLVERKKFAIAVHYRQVDPERVEAVERVVDEVLAAHPELRKAYGKMIFELQPRMDWHKGKALFALLDALEPDQEDVLPFYIGDDVTDEDAFRALKGRGVGIVVREEPYETAAEFSLKNPDEVREFLLRLVALCRKAD